MADANLSCLQKEMKQVKERMNKLRVRSSKFQKELTELQATSKQKDLHIKNLWKIILGHSCKNENIGLTSKEKSKLKEEFIEWFPSESLQFEEEIASAIDNLKDVKESLYQKLTIFQDSSKTDRNKIKDKPNKASLSTSIADIVTSSDDSPKTAFPNLPNKKIDRNLPSYPCSPDSLSQDNNENLSTIQKPPDFNFCSETSLAKEQSLVCKTEELRKTENILSEEDSCDELFDEGTELVMESSETVTNNVDDLSEAHKGKLGEENVRASQLLCNELQKDQNSIQETAVEYSNTNTLCHNIDNFSNDSTNNSRDSIVQDPFEVYQREREQTQSFLSNHSLTDSEDSLPKTFETETYTKKTTPESPTEQDLQFEITNKKNESDLEIPPTYSCLPDLLSLVSKENTEMEQNPAEQTFCPEKSLAQEQLDSVADNNSDREINKIFLIESSSKKFVYENPNAIDPINEDSILDREETYDSENVNDRFSINLSKQDQENYPISHDKSNDTSKIVQPNAFKVPHINEKTYVRSQGKTNEVLKRVIATCEKESSLLLDDHQSLLKAIRRKRKLFAIDEFPLSPIPPTPPNEPDTKVLGRNTKSECIEDSNNKEGNMNSTNFECEDTVNINVLNANGTSSSLLSNQSCSISLNFPVGETDVKFDQEVDTKSLHTLADHLGYNKEQDSVSAISAQNESLSMKSLNATKNKTVCLSSVNDKDKCVSKKQKLLLDDQTSHAAPVRVRGRTRISIEKFKPSTSLSNKEKEMQLKDHELFETKVAEEVKTLKDTPNYTAPHNFQKIRIQHRKNENCLITPNENKINLNTDTQKKIKEQISVETTIKKDLPGKISENKTQMPMKLKEFPLRKFVKSSHDEKLVSKGECTQEYLKEPMLMKTTIKEKLNDAAHEDINMQKLNKLNEEFPAQNFEKIYHHKEPLSNGEFNENKAPTCIEDIISSIRGEPPVTKASIGSVKNSDSDQKTLSSDFKPSIKLMNHDNNHLGTIQSTQTQHSLVNIISTLKPKSICAQKRKNETNHTLDAKKKDKKFKKQKFVKGITVTATNGKDSSNCQTTPLNPKRQANSKKEMCRLAQESKKEKIRLAQESKKEKISLAQEKIKELELQKKLKEDSELVGNQINEFFENLKNDLCEDNLKNIVRSLVKLSLNQSTFPNKATLLFHIFNYLRHTKSTPLRDFALKEDESVLLPFVEKCIVVALLRIEMKKIPHLEGILETAVTSLYNLILTKDFQTFGLGSLCRVFTEICKRLGDSTKPVLLSAEILKTRHRFAPYLIASIAGVWRELFQTEDSVSVEEKLLHSSILYGACKKKPSTLFKYHWDNSMKIFSKYFNAPPVKDPKEAISVLKMYTQSQCQNDSWKSDYTRASLSILALHEDWNWVKENVLDSFIIPNLNKFGKEALNETAFTVYCKFYVDIYFLNLQYSIYNDLSNIYKSLQLWKGEFVEDCVALSLIKLDYLKNRTFPSELNSWFEMNHKNPKVLEESGIFIRKMMLAGREELLVEEIEFCNRKVAFA